MVLQPVQVPRAGPEPLPELESYLRAVCVALPAPAEPTDLGEPGAVRDGAADRLAPQELRHHRRGGGRHLDRTLAAPADRRGLGPAGAGRGAGAPAGGPGPAGGCWCWTTPGCRRRALGRWGWPRSTAARWARWPTARWWSAPSTSRTCRRPAPPALAGQRPAVPARGVGGAAARRRRAHVPEAVHGQTKPELGLTLVDRARTWGVPFAFVVADAGYGQAPRFLAGLETRGLPYACGVKRTFGLRLPDEVAAAARRPRRRTGARPAPGAPAGAPVGRGDPAGRRPRRGVGGGHLAGGDEGRADQGVRRRARPPRHRQPGRRDERAQRRPRAGHHRPGGLAAGRAPPARPGGRPQVVLLVAAGVAPGDAPGAPGHLGPRRWVVEQFYEDAKGACGLADYQGRRWDGLHRHLALVLLTYSFLATQRHFAARPTPTRPAPGARPPLRGRRRRAPRGPAPRPGCRRFRPCTAASSSGSSKTSSAGSRLPIPSSRFPRRTIAAANEVVLGGWVTGRHGSSSSRAMVW